MVTPRAEASGRASRSRASLPNLQVACRRRFRSATAGQPWHVSDRAPRRATGTPSASPAAAWARSTAPRTASSARVVAIKVLAERYADDEAIRGRFTREALAAARLSNAPNTVTIFDVGEHEGRPVHRDGVPAGRLARRPARTPRARSRPGARSAGSGRRPPRSTRRTRAGSSTATSSRRTCSSTTTAACASPTSGSRARPGSTRSPRPAPCSARPATSRPSRRAASRRRRRATATRWPSSPSSCSRARGRSSATRRPPRRWRT